MLNIIDRLLNTIAHPHNRKKEIIASLSNSDDKDVQENINELLDNIKPNRDDG